MATARVGRYAPATSGRLTLARLVHLAAIVVAAIIVVGILLVVLKANQSNQIVSAFHDAARTLAGPFRNLFTLGSHKGTVALDWGIAAVVWYAIGRLIARVLVR